MSIHWATGRWLDSGEPVAVPALATYLNFPAPSSEQFGQTTSNGLAAGASLEEATLSALYELIEHDAFMLFWLAGLRPRASQSRAATRSPSKHFAASSAWVPARNSLWLTRGPNIRLLCVSDWATDVRRLA